MPELRDSIAKFLHSKQIHTSSIFRVLFVLSLFALYSFTIAGNVESFLENKLASSIRESREEQVNVLSPIFDIHVYAGEYDLSSNYGSQDTVGRTKFFTVDPRVLAMNKFLTDYQSPFAKQAEVFITEADKQGLDWRLVVSISGVESAFGNLLPKDSHNAWGWRGINGNADGWSVFSSWEEAATHITERLAQGYGTTLTPFDIQDTYCPPCGATGQDLWAKGVTRFMNELQYYVDNLDSI